MEQIGKNRVVVKCCRAQKRKNVSMVSGFVQHSSIRRSST